MEDFGDIEDCFHELSDNDEADINEQEEEAPHDKDMYNEGDDDDDNLTYENNGKRGRPLGWRKKKEEREGRHRPQRAGRPLIAVHLICSVMCCSALCLADISLNAIASMRQAFCSLSQVEKAIYVKNWLRDHTSNTLPTRFIVGSKDVCLVAWTTVIGLPMSTFYALKKKFTEGIPIKSAGRQKGSLTSDGVYAMVWLEDFATKNGDKMPDDERINLACCLTKSSLYNSYKNENEGVISVTQFMKIWREYLPHIKIPKTTRFTVCDTCVKIAKRLETAKTKPEKRLLHEHRDAHLRQQNLERRKYYKHITKAKTHPDKYLSIILDGMDQDKTSVPHLSTTPKSLSSLYTLKMNLMGAIAHGIGTYGFFDPFLWGHGSSYTISVLVHVLTMLTSLPPTLYLQLDNCPGSNKNRYLLGFMAALVEGNVFDKVKVSFLMVGHTHEDIDQLFSRFSVWLRQNEALTLHGLMSGFEKCYHPQPTALLTSAVYNAQEWLQLNNMKNHSKPHVFRIKRRNGKATLSFKKWSTDKEWHVIDGLLLKNGMDVYKPINEIKSNISRIDIRVQEDIQTTMRFLQKPDLAREWSEFFKALGVDASGQEGANRSIITELYQKRCAAEEEEVIDKGELLEGLALIDEPIPEVFIGKKPPAKRLAKEPDMVNSLHKDDLVAVFTDDEEYDYYIMKVTRQKRTLLTNTHDDWGNEFPPEAKVLEGLYFDRIEERNSYRLILQHRALVHSSAIMYKLNVKCTSNEIEISENEHIKIMEKRDMFRDIIQ